MGTGSALTVFTHLLGARTHSHEQDSAREARQGNLVVHPGEKEKSTAFVKDTYTNLYQVPCTHHFVWWVSNP